jgi:glutaryl-CoA dehydrogenase
MGLEGLVTMELNRGDGSLGSFLGVQAGLAMQLYCRRLADLAIAGRVEPTLAGLAKSHNTTAAREVLAEARDLLGGNGILLDFHVIRHMADIEAIHTFEGTATIQNLIVGRDITGVSAFTAGA